MRKYITAAAAGVIAVYLALYARNIWQYPLDVSLQSCPVAITDAGQQIFHAKLSPMNEFIIPVSLDKMGKYLPSVAINTEDGRFHRHIGIDFLALIRAAWQNITNWRVVSGASTITSQVIRIAVSNRENQPRNLSAKIREFILAVKLESEYSKEQILECYLNIAPFGGNIRGVQAASLIYFGKNADQLSASEACLLVGMLKGPSLYRPDKHPHSARKRRNDVISLMERKKVFTAQEAKRAYLEELPRKKYTMPSRAYHFAELVISQRKEHSPQYNTTLNMEIQTKLEAILRDALGEMPADVTLCAGIADNKSGSIVAWVGNARFSYAEDKRSASWVDCGRAARSPGSALKPFAYLSAIDRGILAPSTVLADTSLAFSGRAPRNFDMTYTGMTTVRTALHTSLNAPAVRVLRMSGYDRILTYLRALGFRHLSQPAKYYGDSLILGGCDVTLLELLEGYTAIASMGLHRELRILKEDNPAGRRIASEAACWLISDILRYRGELSLTARGTLGGKWDAALKTGTSYGLRDAWACAWTPDYTVCVWAGKPNGSSWEGLVGARVSAPIAIKILRAVSPASTWYERPKNVVARKVCTLSGKPPLALCPSVKTEWAIDGVSQTKPCDIHTVKAGRISANMPEGFTPEGGRASSLNIVSPIPGASYFTAPLDTDRKIPLRAEGSKSLIYWYIDGKYTGSSKAGQILFRPISDGLHEVSAADENGQTSSVNVEVHTPGKNFSGEKLF